MLVTAKHWAEPNPELAIATVRDRRNPFSVKTANPKNKPS